MAPERAGTERAPSGGVSLAPTDRFCFMRGRGTARGPHRWASLLGRSLRRVSLAALDAQPERPLRARGAKRNQARRVTNDRLHAVERRNDSPAQIPRPALGSPQNDIQSGCTSVYGGEKGSLARRAKKASEPSGAGARAPS